MRVSEAEKRRTNEEMAESQKRVGAPEVTLIDAFETSVTDYRCGSPLCDGHHRGTVYFGSHSDGMVLIAICKEIRQGQERLRVEIDESGELQRVSAMVSYSGAENIDLTPDQLLNVLADGVRAYAALQLISESEVLGRVADVLLATAEEVKADA